ncbi:MBG domain-containing protein [Ekhidna sp.]
MNFKTKLIYQVLIACLIFFLSIDTTFSQWAEIGSSDASTNNSDVPSLAFDSDGVPYIAFEDGNFESGPDGGALSVLKYNGSSLENVGSARFSPGQVRNPRIAIDSQNTLYVAFGDDTNGSKAMVMKFDGSDWVTVGIAGFSGAEALDIDIAINSSDVPYVAFRDEDEGSDGKTTIMRFNGTAWEPVGNTGFSSSTAQSQSLKFDSNDVPYVAHIDSDVDNGIFSSVSVMTLNGTTWENVGVPLFSNQSSGQVNLALDSDDVPYVAFRDGGTSNKTTVMKYDGSAWAVVGLAGISVGNTFSISISLDSYDVPHVAFSDGGNSGMASVMKFNGTTWGNVGVSGFSAGSSESIYIDIDDNDNPYVVYVDNDNNSRITLAANLTARPITSNKTLSVLPGNSLVLGTSNFNFTGILPADVLDNITLISVPDGTLFIDADDSGMMDNGEVALTEGSTVSKAILDNDQLLFINDGTDTEFRFNVSDGTVSSSVKTITFNILPLTVTVTSITRQSPLSEYTKADEVVFQVLFDKNVLNVDISDFVLSGSSAGDGMVSAVSQIDGKIYEVIVSGLANLNGTINLDIKGNGVATGSNDILEDNEVLRGLKMDAPAIDETFILDDTAPVANTFSPTNNILELDITTDFVITFDGNMKKGIGNVLIKDALTDEIVQSIDVSNTNVTISNSEVTIDPVFDLKKSSNYYIEIESTAFEDLAGNAYTGISDKTIWNFSTELKTAPSISFIDIAKTYGDADFELGASTNSTGIITYNIEREANGTALSGNNNKTVTLGDVGVITIRAQVAEDANYLAGQTDIELTIDQKTLIFLVDDQEKNFGDEDPMFTYELIFGELESGDEFTGELIRELGEDAGTYAINQGSFGGLSDNYDFAYVGAMLTINKADQIIAIDPIDDKESIDAQFDVIASVDSDLNLTYAVNGPATISGATIELDGSSGTVTVTVSQGGGDNFKSTTSSVSFEVSLVDVLGFERGLSKSVKVYPNPFVEYLVIDSSELVDLRLYGLDGQLAKEMKRVSGRVDFSTLKAGMYLMEMSNSEEKVTMRVYKSN